MLEKDRDDRQDKERECERRRDDEHRRERALSRKPEARRFASSRLPSVLSRSATNSSAPSRLVDPFTTATSYRTVGCDRFGNGIAISRDDAARTSVA